MNTSYGDAQCGGHRSEVRQGMGAWDQGGIKGGLGLRIEPVSARQFGQPAQVRVGRDAGSQAET